ncbi:Lincomycin resistance protein LmrB [Lentibacillus sp. JNUCC-1]|uniref:DHA2 family efflux MFS transporter permease subunit n=1 Tax=Lentibacillus sp. JNUCC-1 TaxID=2654513 RepID=UPI0012E72251|nr:DHA2 family efflux MFS transporter permease subunit [Lentibacillus sp. JNUCC-1]MUV38235.1 Lincomycin resistance protein LmrB [Lentibacillus sp. JNUCC-1]
MFMEKTSQAQTHNPQVKAAPIMAALLISGFMGMFSETALNMAINDLIKAFSISPSTAQWLTTGYLLVLGIVIPVSGLLIKRFPTRKLFVTSLSFSILGVLVAGISPNFWILLSGRIIQAIGTGLLLPLLFHTVLIIFPPWKRGTAMGIVGLVMMFAPATGPISAGLIIEYFNWHMIFWIITPFLIFALVFGIIFLPNLTKVQKHKIDLLSIILSTVGFGGIVFGFSFAGESEGWSSPIVISALITGTVALVLYVFRQLSIDEPVLYLKVFRHPMFILGIVATLFANIIIFSGNILLPLFMRAGLGLTASAAGLLLLPGGIVNGIMSMVNGRIFDKHGPKALVIGGFALSTVTVWFFSKVTSSTSPYLIIIFFMLLMVSMSMVTTPSQTNGINQLEPELYPDGTAVVNSMIQTSGAIGTALAVSILNMTQRSLLAEAANPADTQVKAEALISGVQNAFTFAMIISILGLITSLFIKRIRV